MHKKYKIEVFKHSVTTIGENNALTSSTVNLFSFQLNICVYLIMTLRSYKLKLQWSNDIWFNSTMKYFLVGMSLIFLWLILCTLVLYCVFWLEFQRFKRPATTKKLKLIFFWQKKMCIIECVRFSTSINDKKAENIKILLQKRSKITF